jgi:hypothetical protein
MRLGAVPLLVVCAVSVFSLPAQAGCRWDGSGPWCRGECSSNEVQVRRWDGGGIIFSPFDLEGSLEPHFGAGCPSGSKALCCTKCGPGLVFESTPLAQRCVTPDDKAAYDAHQVSPGQQFCDYYATRAVQQVTAAAECKFPPEGRWDPNKQIHLTWCLAQKGQSSSWSEYYTREGLLKDCLAKLPPPPPSGPGPISLGVPIVTLPKDVEIYDKPGGAGQLLGIVRAGSKVSWSETAPDDKNWCHIFGDPVPKPPGHGWVWCGPPGYELKQ